MTVEIRCFTNIADAEPAHVFAGDAYAALVEHPSPSQAKIGDEYARVVLNPDHSDPNVQKQFHVRAGERNSTDPLRFARVEVFQNGDGVEVPSSELVRVWYGDVEGNVAPVDVELDIFTELSFDALVKSNASVEDVKKAIAKLDYVSLADELKTRAPENIVPQKRVDREDALLALVRP